ncbi:hypothetical protein D3C87_253320 [compost metagenome]
MKNSLVILLVLLTGKAFAGGFLVAEPVTGSPDPLANYRFTPEVRKAIEKEARAFDALPTPTSAYRYDAPQRLVVIRVPIERPMAPVEVFGFTQQEVLAHDGDTPNGDPCGSKHEQGDLSNRWCHAYFVTLTNKTLRNSGVNKEVSALLAATIFLPKEYLIDQKPSASDLVMADYEIFDAEKNLRRTRMGVTIFGDKTVFLTFYRNFSL